MGTLIDGGTAQVIAQTQKVILVDSNGNDLATGINVVSVSNLGQLKSSPVKLVLVIDVDGTSE